MKKNIITITGDLPGPTVAIFGGVHGDEQAGILTVDYLIKNLQLKKGVVHLVYANPRAIEKNVRFTEKNLNRCFVSDSCAGDAYEEKRAVELMKILDSCDALLDLHAYNERYGESIPFAICEEDGFEIVKKFGVSHVLTSIDQYEKGGSDGYMYNNGKIGICVELGAIEQPEKFVPLGIETAYIFLAHFGMVQEQHNTSIQTYDQKVLTVSSIYKKSSDSFTFAKNFKTFDFIAQSELICTDGTREVRAQQDEYILFPQSTFPVGTEAYLTAIDI